MSYDEHLLPPNATAFERALSSPSGRILDIPVPIDLLKDPARIPASLLPWIAWEFSIDVWDEGWPEAVQRDVIARWFDLHRQKGTLKGISDHIGLTGSEVVRAVQPPQEVYWAPEDAATLAAWKAKLPQIRIYPFRLPGDADGFYWDTDFFGDDGDGEGQANGFYWPDGGPDTMGRRATLWTPDGAEVDVSWMQGAGPFTPEGVERFGLPGLAAQGGLYFDHGFLDHDFLTEDEGDFETVAIERSGIGEIVNAGYRATSVEPELVMAAGTAAQDALYLDHGFWDVDYLLADEAAGDVYERFYLFIPERWPGDPDPYFYWDNDRFGIAAYTAELLVDTQEHAVGPISFDDDAGFQVPPDFTQLWRTADAAVISKALRDQVLLDTEVWRRPQFGDRRRFSDGLRFNTFVRA